MPVAPVAFGAGDQRLIIHVFFGSVRVLDGQIFFQADRRVFKDQVQFDRIVRAECVGQIKDTGGAVRIMKIPMGRILDLDRG